MNCSQAQKLLYPGPGRCALSIETAQALEHLRRCEECRRYFETQAEWSRALRDKAGTLPAPEALRERVAGMTAEPAGHLVSTPVWRRKRWVAAMVLLGAGAGGFWFASQLPSQLFFRELCEDHARYLSGESQVRSSSGAEIESWFGGKTDFSVRVPALENAETLGGRLCFMRGHKAALVFYRKRGRPVSLFQFAERDASLRALSHWELDGVPFWRISWKGFSVVAFRERGVVYALVSDLRESELVGLAAALHGKARGL